MRISGETTIFRNAHEGKDGTWYSYATGVSSKKQDGTYVNAYLNVRFRKGVVVENKTKINIKDAFLTAREYVTNGNLNKTIELMILDFEPVDGYMEHDIQESFSALDYNDVPF